MSKRRKRDIPANKKNAPPAKGRPRDTGKQARPAGRPTLPAIYEPKHPGGRPPFKPTAKQREAVESMAGYGMTQADIAHLVTEDGIDPKTLREYFPKELDRGG